MFRYFHGYIFNQWRRIKSKHVYSWAFFFTSFITSIIWGRTSQIDSELIQQIHYKPSRSLCHISYMYLKWTSNAALRGLSCNNVVQSWNFHHILRITLPIQSEEKWVFLISCNLLRKSKHLFPTESLGKTCEPIKEVECSSSVLEHTGSLKLWVSLCLF